jgi:sodium/potassium-transporting ATPase subunit alpha
MGNPAIFWALLIEIFTICMLVYVPGLNGFLGLSSVKPIWASSGLFIIPFIFLWDETRKAIIRKHPNGWVSRLTII